jgi:hypothetical protein
MLITGAIIVMEVKGSEPVSVFGKKVNSGGKAVFVPAIVTKFQSLRFNIPE